MMRSAVCRGGLVGQRRAIAYSPVVSHRAFCTAAAATQSDKAQAKSSRKTLLRLAAIAIAVGAGAAALPDILISPDSAITESAPKEGEGVPQLLDSYYKQVVQEPGRSRPALAGPKFEGDKINGQPWEGGISRDEVDADVCIIGGGFAGLHTALGLAERHPDLRIAVLEAKRIGWGASGLNGGFAVRGFQVEGDELSEMVGQDTAIQMHDYSSEGLRVLRRRIKDYGIRCDAADVGQLCLSFLPGNNALEDSEQGIAEYNKHFGTNIKVWDKAMVRRLYKSEQYHHGIYDPSVFTVNPLGLVRGLARAAEAKGVRIYEATQAAHIHDTGKPNHEKSRRYRVNTNHGGVVRARQVVVAGAAHVDVDLDRSLARSVAPVYTYILVTSPISDGKDTTAPVVPPTALEAAKNAQDKPECQVLNEEINMHPFPGPAVCDDRFALNYYRPLPDGRLLWGGLAQTYPIGKDNLKDTMMRDLLKIYPQLEGRIKPEYAWGGTLALGFKLMPMIGRKEDNDVWYATGFGGHGVVPTCMAGEVLASAISATMDEDNARLGMAKLKRNNVDSLMQGNEYKLFQEKFPLAYAAYPFARVAAQMLYWSYGAADKLRQWQRYVFDPSARADK